MKTKRIAKKILKNENLKDKLLTDENLKDPEFMFEMIKTNDKFIDYLSEELKNDYNFQKKLVDYKFDLINSFENTNVWKDKDFVLGKILENIDNIKNIPKNYLNEKMVFSLLDQYKENLLDYLEIDKKRDNFSHLTGNHNVMFRFFEMFGNEAFSKISKNRPYSRNVKNYEDIKVLNDDSFMLKIIKKNPNSIIYSSKKLLKDPSFLKKAFDTNKEVAFTHVFPRRENDERLEKIDNHIEIIKFLAKNYKHYSIISPKYKKNVEVFKAFIKDDPKKMLEINFDDRKNILKDEENFKEIENVFKEYYKKNEKTIKTNKDVFTKYTKAYMTLKEDYSKLHKEVKKEENNIKEKENKTKRSR